MIDATRMGNVSRFMNHSCNPNCQTAKWIVNGRQRVGLFTRSSIPAGTELTFDYRFRRLGRGQAQRCLCGEANCKGWIGGEPEDEDTSDDSLDSGESVASGESLATGESGKSVASGGGLHSSSTHGKDATSKEKIKEQTRSTLMDYRESLMKRKSPLTNDSANKRMLVEEFVHERRTNFDQTRRRDDGDKREVRRDDRHALERHAHDRNAFERRDDRNAHGRNALDRNAYERRDERLAHEKVAHGKREVKSAAAALQEGWREARTEDGQVYYYHEVSRETRWDPPLAASTPLSTGSVEAIIERARSMALARAQASSSTDTNTAQHETNNERGMRPQSARSETTRSESAPSERFQSRHSGSKHSDSRHRQSDSRHSESRHKHSDSRHSDSRHTDSRHGQSSSRSHGQSRPSDSRESTSQSDNPKHDDDSRMTADLRDLIGREVVRFMSSRMPREQFGSTEEFKQLARRLTHGLTHKESQRSSGNSGGGGDGLGQRIKVYLEDYMDKHGYKTNNKG